MKVQYVSSNKFIYPRRLSFESCGATVFIRMDRVNPYAQAGWFNPNSQLTPSHPTWTPAPPLFPTFGALPWTTAEQSPDWIRLTFVSADGDILDCSVVGSSNQTFYEISTESQPGMPMITTFVGHDRKGFARIEWAPVPLVEIKNFLYKQRVTEWIMHSTESRQ